MLSSRPSHVIHSYLLRVSYRVRHINDLVRLSTLIGRMVPPAIATSRRWTLTPTLPGHVPSTTKVMEFLPYPRVPTRTRITTPKITLPVLAITSSPVVLLLWWTVTPLALISAHSTKLFRVTRLTALHTPHTRNMPTRLYRRR